jgi:hypothetical protein
MMQWTERGATLSACGTYRYNLVRRWSMSAPQACVIMLNPSTADADKDDPTIRKLIGFGQRLGWGGFEVVNLYSYRATKPAALRAAGYPGQRVEDDRYIIQAAIAAKASGGPVICAWGANARGMQRPMVVRAVLRHADITELRALRLLPDGTPEHPLMLPYNDDEGKVRQPVPYAV